MQVIELPKDDPAMQVDKKVIGVNDNFKAVCTVGPSYPPANITWYINGRKVGTNLRFVVNRQVLINAVTGIQNAAAAHNAGRIRGLDHILLPGNLSAQPGVAGLLPGNAQISDQHTAALRGIHTACVPQECAAAHWAKHGTADNHFTQFAGPRGLQALCQWRSG